MFQFIRAGRVAAAFAALAAAISFATPSLAQVVPTPQFDHSAAILDGSNLVVGNAPSAASPSVSPAPGAGLAGIFRTADMVASHETQSVAEIPRTLDELVVAFAGTEISDAEQECLAGAVYFEARSEPIEGQLAVARVVLNRAASGRYPPRICDVVTQPSQFSFIRGGKFPKVNRNSEAWRKAVAISHIALAKLAAAIEIPSNVLWYHASYVSPSWGKRLKRQARIGLHIFYS